MGGGIVARNILITYQSTCPVRALQERRLEYTCDVVQRLIQEGSCIVVETDVAEAFGDCAMVFICGILVFSARAKLRCTVRS